MSAHLSPLQALVLIDGAVDAEGDTLEPPEREDEERGEDAEDDGFCLVRDAF